MVHPNEPKLPRTDVSRSEFEVGAPTAEEVDKKKNRIKRVPNSPLTAVIESRLLSNLHCRFLILSLAHFSFCLQVMAKRFREFPEMTLS